MGKSGLVKKDNRTQRKRGRDKDFQPSTLGNLREVKEKRKGGGKLNPPICLCTFCSANEHYFGHWFGHFASLFPFRSHCRSVLAVNEPGEEVSSVI